MTLTEFLLARIAEDEQIAQGATAGVRVLVDSRPAFGRPDNTPNSMPGVVLPATRALAECAAKRRIVDFHQREDWVPGSGRNPHCTTCAEWDEADQDGPPEVLWPCPTVRVLALPYADHPDYREEWKP